jgi:hypothetical protein
LRRSVTGCPEYYAHSIDNILENKRGKDLINFQETAVPSEATLFSRFYRVFEFPPKLQIIHKFCKFVFVFPKLYNLDAFQIVRRYIHLRRRKREKTMRKILEEINDSNMNLLSLDYVIFCETTCLPVDLQQFSKTKLAMNKAAKLGSICLGLSDSNKQLDVYTYGVTSEANLAIMPFETEESTILGGNPEAKEQNSFVDAVFLVDRPEVRQGRVPVKQSFNFRRSELKLPFNAKKPLKSVYSSYKNKEADGKKPLPPTRMPKEVVYQKKETPKDPYKTASDNDTGANSSSKRQIRIPDFFGIKSNKSSSHRDVGGTAVKFSLGTNKLITASARTINVKKTQKMTLTPIGETEVEPTNNDSHQRMNPSVTSEPFRGLNGSFKQSSLITPYLQAAEPPRKSGILLGGFRVPSQRSVKFAASQKRPTMNKKSIEEYREHDSPTKNAGGSQSSSPESAPKRTSLGPFCVYPVPCKSNPGLIEVSPAGVASHKSRAVLPSGPAAQKPGRDLHHFAIKPFIKPFADPKTRQVLKQSACGKSGNRPSSSKSGPRFLSSTFQLIAPHASGVASGVMSKQSFAAKGEVKTSTNLADVDNDRSCKQMSREASRGEGRIDFSTWMARFRSQKSSIDT